MKSHDLRYPSPQATGNPARESACERTRVFVVDNHELVRRGLAALLNAETDTVCCGEALCDDAAMAAIEEAQPDVVIIDVSAMRSAGLEIVQRIRKLDTQIRIIALAMMERPELVERSLSAGAEAFVSKNGLAGRVLEAVRRNQVTREDAEMARGVIAKANGRMGARLDALEREVVELIGRGVPDRGIAIRMGISLTTVDSCRRRIRNKLNCPTATQLVELCARWTARANAGEGVTQGN